MCQGHSGLFNQPYKHQQDNCPDRGVDDRCQYAAANTDPDEREQPAGNESADNANHDIAYEAKAEALDELPRKPACNRANDDEDDQTLNAHMQVPPVARNAIMSGDGSAVQPSPRDFLALFVA